MDRGWVAAERAESTGGRAGKHRQRGQRERQKGGERLDPGENGKE